MPELPALPELPGAPGAYVLIVTLDRPLRLALPGMHGAVLGPGRYAYCGSAHGPGGIRARVLRHLRRDKRPHWHIDRLTGAGRVAAVHAAPGARECSLLERILAVPGASAPVAGFGSTDCRRCPAHLACLPGTMDGAVLAKCLNEISRREETWRATHAA